MKHRDHLQIEKRIGPEDFCEILAQDFASRHFTLESVVIRPDGFTARLEQYGHRYIYTGGVPRRLVIRQPWEGTPRQAQIQKERT